LLQTSHEAVKEDIPAMEMRYEIDATDLLMTRQVGDEERDPNNLTPICSPNFRLIRRTTMPLSAPDHKSRCDWKDQSDGWHALMGLRKHQFQ
jgi:hypothetical protein